MFGKMVKIGQKFGKKVQKRVKISQKFGKKVQIGQNFGFWVEMFQ